MRQEKTIDFQIRGAWAKIARIYNAEASNFGGTMSIGYILLNIDKNGSPSTSLGPKMGMESTSLTRSLKKMEENGLITRMADIGDKRRVIIKLTKEGLQLRKTSKKHVIQLNNQLRSKIDGEKMEVFMDVIKEINTILDRNGIFNDD